MNILFISIPKNASNTITKTFNLSTAFYHQKASVCKALIRNYDSLYTFACVRNPIDLIISWYNYHKYNMRESQYVRDFYPNNIEDWILIENCKTHWEVPFHKTMNPHWDLTNPLHQYKWVYDNQNVLLVNKIIHFENLQNALQSIARDLHLSIPLNIVLNATEKHTCDLTERAICKVKDIFAKDFELFNYDV